MLIVACLWAGLPAHAKAEVVNPSGVVSTAHVGYAVESSSSTGFRNAGGSLLMFDLTWKSQVSFDLGLRTVGTGASADGAQFYRMGAGPMARWRVMDKLAIVAAGFAFQESGTTDERSEVYGSRGHGAMFGWEKRHRLGTRVEIAWGGFLARHWGGFKTDQADQPATGAAAALSSNASHRPAGRFADIQRNVGMTRGIGFSISTAL